MRRACKASPSRTRSSSPTSTRRLLGNLFELQDLGAKEVKGIAEPVRAWAALRASSVESRFEALRTATTPLVGRDEEIELLMRRWEQAKAGDGWVVLISGEPGIGKSRIAETIVERLGAEPHTRLRYFCSPHHQDSALYPTITQLERAAGFRREDTAEQRLDKLEALLARGPMISARPSPASRTCSRSRPATATRHSNLTPQKRKEKTLHGAGGSGRGAGRARARTDGVRGRPLERPNDAGVARPARSIGCPALRVLVIITFRPEFTPPWVGRPHVTLLSLNRLPPRQRAEMITRVTGGKALPKEIADQIIDRTDGVPLFIEELTKAVVESGVVTEAGDHYAVTGPVGAAGDPDVAARLAPGAA